jgi:hypothetical protein
MFFPAEDSEEYEDYTRRMMMLLMRMAILVRNLTR